jgi:hypothetical protein
LKKSLTPSPSPKGEGSRMKREEGKVISEKLIDKDKR